MIIPAILTNTLPSSVSTSAREEEAEVAKGREPAGAREKWGREARWSRVRRDFGVCESVREVI